MGWVIKFDALYTLATDKQNLGVVSPFIAAGIITAAILANGGNVFLSLSIDTEW